MKKLVVVFLLFAVVASVCVFAEEPETTAETVNEKVTEKRKSLFNSVQIGAGFDLFTAKGKFNDGDSAKSNSKAAFGLSLSTTIDLSAIPNFLKEGWYGYVGFDLFFSKKMTFFGQKLPNPDSGLDLRNSVGFKIHLAILRQVDFNIPVDFFFGAGIARDNISGKLVLGVHEETLSATSWGLTLYAEGSYKLGKHFAVSATVIPDITFVTKLQAREADGGFITTAKRTSFSFGFDLGVKAGIKVMI